MKENTDDISWSRIAKHLGDALNALEKEQFEQWEKASEYNHTEKEKAEKIWELTKPEGAEVFDTDNGWLKLKGRIHKDDLQKKETTFNAGIFLRVAASILFILGLSFAINHYLNGTRYSTVVAHDQKQPVILPDGSKVLLNAGASLKYPRVFGATRDVALTGEAFFNVMPDKNKPFIIRTSEASIKVVGTSFNVLATKETDSVQVVVETGIVELTPKQLQKKIILSKGTSGCYYAQKQLLKKYETADVNAFAWKTNTLIFKNARLSYVINVLQKQFSKPISCNNDQLKEYRLTADYIELSLEDILKALETSHCLKIIKKQDRYIITGPGC